VPLLLEPEDEGRRGKSTEIELPAMGAGRGPPRQVSVVLSHLRCCPLSQLWIGPAAGSRRSVVVVEEDARGG
jgi:hypothetical protein